MAILCLERTSVSWRWLRSALTPRDGSRAMIGLASGCNIVTLMVHTYVARHELVANNSVAGHGEANIMITLVILSLLLTPAAYAMSVAVPAAMRVEDKGNAASAAIFASFRSSGEYSTAELGWYVVAVRAAVGHWSATLLRFDKATLRRGSGHRTAAW